jgi:crotonobetainyl-CoA:carnitine CoA-transferase CaiB-like acyl-CoA transferase
MSAIFNGIKILDLTRVVAGPLCTQNMADMGATVYKIEKPGEGDDTRRMGPFMSDAGNAGSSNESAVFLAYNRGKHSITVDIAQPEGAALVRDLASRCDVVVENYKTGSLAKYGLDYASVRQRKPDVIYCSVTGFGQTGPYAGRPAYDFILQGMAGAMSTCGLPDGEPGATPTRTSIPITDIVTGLYANIAVVSALYHRERTGQGQYIDVAMLDASVAFNGHLAVGYLMTGKVPQRAGNTNPIAAPSEVFRCVDGLAIIAAGNNSQFAGLCRVVGRPELTVDERFAGNASRVANRTALIAILAPVLEAYLRDELLARLLECGVPCGPINDMAQVFSDQQTRHRALAMPLRHASGADVTLVRSPLRFSASPVEHRTPPLLGEHSEQVLAEELGLTDAQIRGLRERGIL